MLITQEGVGPDHLLLEQCLIIGPTREYPLKQEYFAISLCPFLCNITSPFFGFNGCLQLVEINKHSTVLAQSIFKWCMLKIN